MFGGELFLIVLGLIWIAFAAVQDIKMREVADWLSFSLIIFVLGFRFFYSLFENNWWFFLWGLVGLLLFGILGNLFYYSRVFAGGDAKLLIALGAVLPLASSLRENLIISGVFLFLFLFVGALYGLFYSIILSCRDMKKFGKTYKEVFGKNKKRVIFSLVLALVFLVGGFYYWFFIFIAILIFITPYLLIFAKTVEKAFMIKEISREKLREGDWLYKDLKVRNKIIKANWDGLTRKDIEFIRKNYKKNVVIKEGIPFVPVFLIAFLILIYLWYSSWKFILYFLY